MMRRLLAVFVACCLFLGTWGLPVLATDAVEGLTMDKAVEMSLKNSTTVKQADYDLQRSYEAKELAETQSNFSVTPTQPLTIDIWTIVTNAHVKYLSWQISDKTKSITVDKAAMSTIQKYIAVLQAKELVDTTSDALDYATWSRNTSQTNYRLGMLSKYNLTLAEDSYQKAKNTYDQAQIGLESAYRDLNYLTGASTNLPLLNKPEYSAFDSSSINTRIQAIIDTNPSIWITDQGVNQSKMSLDTFNGTGDTYKGKQIDVDKADLTATDTRKQAQQKLLTQANTIQNDEDSYPAKQHALETAQENLRIKQLMFDIGMATKGDLLTATSDLAAAQKALNDLIYHHEIAKMQFEKPWTL